MAPDHWSPWLRLKLTPGIGERRAHALLQAFGSAQAVFDQPPSTLADTVGEKLGWALSQCPEGWQDACEATRAWLHADPQRHVLTWDHPDYPAALLHIPDPPPVLFVQGRLNALSHPRLVAMVGSRNPTAQGAQLAHDFARHFAADGVGVVSGMALGIDGAAHQGALDGEGLTVAVVGTGLDRVYPRQHQTLAHAIAERGALVSELLLGSGPLPAHFPRRNRIIAGLSQATLVVEANVQSGSLITAQEALEQGREVFAVPGSVHSPQSKGCHQLIRQGALLVESALDVMTALAWTGPISPNVTPLTDSPEETDPLLRALGWAPIAMDTLHALTGHPPHELQAQLMLLELQGQVARLPGGAFQRLQPA